MSSASLGKVKLNGSYLAANLFLNKLLKNLARSGECYVTEGVNLSAAESLADVSAIGELNTLGDRNEKCGMVLLQFVYRLDEFIGIKGSFGKIDKVGSFAARNYGKCRRRSEPACISAHYLDYCNSLH